MKQISLLLLITLPFFVGAQDISGGVRIGLNFNNFSGPSETDASGNELETYDGNTGFLVGGMINVGITDLIGLRGELLFSQKGGRRKYDGPAAVFFNRQSSSEVAAIGTREYVVRVANAYIDIPLTVYVRPIEKLKIFAGANIGFLVRSVGFGEYSFTGSSISGQVPINFTTTLNHNYLRDNGYNSAEFIEPTNFVIDSKTVQIPTESNAYQLDFAERSSSIFNNIDVGVLGGLSYQLNGSLFISAMYNLGLIDVTNDETDIAYAESISDSGTLLSDIDTNRSLQISIGFTF